ncbi:MAG: electron transfer flavoprotein subunit beta/FixA family protein [Chthonomonas sp.]|nr:electron transfer flavoprotein subunit beta/FixA family protein [Chthonomonas sp.]
MKILVPIKRVIDPYAKVRPSGDGQSIETTGVKFDINPFDEIAVEEAVRMKEKDPSAEVVVVSVGGGEVEEQLRKALAIGADRAILVEKTGDTDPGIIARELKAVVATESPNLILMGKQSTDGDNSQVGPTLAAMLDWPHASFASKISIEGGTATVTRETDLGEETVQMPLPCLITADLRLNEPRYIALPGIVKARSKPLAKVASSNSDSARVKTVAVSAVAPRGAGQRVDSVDSLVTALRDKGVLN